MKKGYALIIGLNEVQPQHYSNWDGRLSQPEQDATVIKTKAEEYKFESKLLITKDATRDNVTNAILDMAIKAEAGDIVFIFYSGHGGQVPTIGYYDDDENSETWCLYDGQLLDKELYSMWPKFKEGVRVFLVSDSCHSGTMTKVMPTDLDSNLIPKNMPAELIGKVCEENEPFYKKIYARLAALPKQDIKVSVLSYGGCQDYELSYCLANSKYSLFTSQFLKTLEHMNGSSVQTRAEEYSYNKAIESIRTAVNKKVPMQTPSIYEIGENGSFRNQILLQI